MQRLFERCMEQRKEYECHYDSEDSNSCKRFQSTVSIILVPFYSEKYVN